MPISPNSSDDFIEVVLRVQIKAGNMAPPQPAEVGNDDQNGIYSIS